MENRFTHRLLGKTVAVLSHALDYRTKNHTVIAGNLSNMDTPGYRPKELSFDEELKQAVNRDTLTLTKTDRKHISGLSGNRMQASPSFAIGPYSQSGQGAPEINLDHEMAKMAQNNLMYETTVKLLSKKLAGLKMAIEGRRI
jgi:flagellar basal-body rod protein FlgB